MEWPLTELGVVGLLASAVLMLVREIVSRRSPTQSESDPLDHSLRDLQAALKAVGQEVDHLSASHRDPNSVFSTVEANRRLEQIDRRLELATTHHDDSHGTILAKLDVLLARRPS
jgi:hypothetical protein